MIQILYERLMMLTNLDEQLIHPNKTEAINMLFMYEYIFCLCASEHFVAGLPTEVFGFRSSTDVNVLKESCNKTYQYLLWQLQGKWIGNDIYSFTVWPYRFTLIIR